MDEAEPGEDRRFARLLPVALALVSGATLLYEVAVTRLLSVVAWYYLAFVSISTAMLGMAAGALAVQLRPARFTAARVPEDLQRSAMAMAFALPACLLVLLAIPVEISNALQTLVSFLLFCAVLAVPFFFSGIFVCLALTRSGRPFSQLYGADLAGAALGCGAAVLLLSTVDACSAIMVVGALPAAAAMLLQVPGAPGRVRRLALCLALVGAGALNSTTAHGIQPIWSKGAIDTRRNLVLERWNPISRVRVLEPQRTTPPVWGASPLLPMDAVESMQINIDNDAGTAMVAYDGTLPSARFLAYDVTSLGAALRAGSADAVVIGVGGGRDVLGAHVAGFRHVVGLEVNGAMLDLVQRDFRDFNNLHRIPGVELHHAEARSWMSATDQRFDLIQASMVDTWAATSAGAMSLTENGLYTVEAWRLFLQRLKPGGVIAFSRWYNARATYETRRLLGVALAALLEEGVANPARHVAVITSSTVATTLVSNRPLSEADRQRLRQLVDTLQFQMVVMEGTEVRDPVMARQLAATSTAELDAVEDDLMTYRPSRDRSPFFFNTIRLSRLPQAATAPVMSGNARALLVLLCFLAASAVLATATILWPVRGMGGSDRASIVAGGHVALLGAAFMLVEIGAMQQLSLLLGHPSYSLVVVLGGLLVATGAGSLLSGRLREGGLATRVPALASAVVTLAYAWSAEPIVERAMGSSFPARVGLSLALLVPMGLAMGGCLPMAMRAARAASLEARLPWLWAINGALSVLATFVAVLLSMQASIPATIATGGAAYLLASLLVPRPA